MKSNLSVQIPNVQLGAVKRFYQGLALLRIMENVMVSSQIGDTAIGDTAIGDMSLKSKFCHRYVINLF